MSRKRVILAAMLAVVACAALLWPRGTAELAYDVHPVQRTELQDRILERGILTPLRSVKVAAAGQGDILEIAQTGTRVAAGDPIVRIDPDDVSRRMEEIELSLSSAQTDLESQEAQYEFVALREANRLEKQRNSLALADLREADAKVALTPEDRRLLEIDRRIAELNLKEAQQELTRQQSLLAKGFVSKTQIESYERRVSTAEARLTELDATMALREKGRPAEEIVELEREAARLRAVIERGERAMARRLALVSNEIAVAMARIEKEEHRLAYEREQLNQTVTTAPTNGVFTLRLYRDWRSGGGWEEYKAGRSVRRMDLVGDVINPGDMSVDFLVHEVDISRIATGLPVRVRVPALAGRSFKGEVVALGGLGRDRFELAPEGQEESQTGVTVFNARARVDAEDAEFSPGMSAEVEVLLGSPTTVLTIPRAAVRHDATRPRQTGEHDAWAVLENGDRVAIRGAFRGPHAFAVASGLEEGDAVRVPRPEGAER